MLQNERYDQIYQILKERQSASVQLLQKRLFVSEATIRRDLAAMENLGLLRRVWGGAVLQMSADKETPFFIRIKTNQDKKQRIAKIASSFLRESISIFLDESTTVLALIPYLSQYKQLTLITNGIRAQEMLTEQTSHTVHMIGGQILEGRITVGHIALANVRQYHPNLMFFSCSGISARTGITGTEAKAIEVQREMMAHAQTKILLCDSDKVGVEHLWVTAALDDVDYVIMDRVPDDRKLTEALGKRLLT